MAYKIALLPITEISDIFNKVTFPVFTAIGGDRSRLRTAFWKTFLTVLSLSIPFAIVLIIFPTQLVRIMLGEQWLTIVPLLPVLGIFGAYRAVLDTCFPLFLSVKKQQYITWMTLWSITGLALTILPFVTWWGLPGAALSALVGTLIATPYVIYRIWYVLYR